MSNESGAERPLQQPNATLPGENATRASNNSSTYELSHASTRHPMEAVPEPLTTSPVDQNAEEFQEAKEDRSLLQQKVASTIGSPAFSLHDRFGWLATTILVVTTTLILSVLGFLWFLWEADHNNKTWHRIAAKNWMTRTVALSSLVLRTSMSMQASTATSMLAGLALENTQILLLHFASVSMMRNTNAGPYMLSWLIFKAFLKDPWRWRRALIPTLILVLVITSTLAQFTSTTLLADLKPGTVPGYNSSETTATNFHTVDGSTPFTLRGTVWTKKPPFYPTFAEYHELPSDAPEDKSDTGLTLRAFLPVPGQEARSSLRTFSGLATVLDARVQCLRPQLTLEKGHFASGTLALNGSISASGSQSTNFSCVIPQPLSDSDGNTSDEWQIAVTYLSTFSNASTAPVRSEFRPLASPSQYGMEFVVVNVTAGSIPEYLQILGDDGGEFGDFGAAGVAPALYSNRREWLDLLFTKNASLVMSVSLCYASSNIRSQLGQILNGQHMQSPDERGVLSLSKRGSWEPGPGDDANSSWLQAAVELSLVGDPVDTQYLDTTTSTVSTSITAYFFSATEYSKQAWEAIPRLSPDPSVIALFQQILKDQGGIAFAIQSILTIFTSMSYYDQLQQFNNADKITTTSFVVVSKPASLRGIIAVTIVASVHMVLIAYVIYLFLFNSSISTVGNAWQTVAQVVQGEAKQLVDGARLATDDKVEDMVRNRRWKRRFVGLRVSGDRTDVELNHTDSLGGLAKMMKDAKYKRHKLKCRTVGLRTKRRTDAESG